MILAWETCEWAQQTCQNAILVKLDFDKSYDRVRWNFILSMLKWLGFGPKLQAHVRMLFQDANSQIIINNMMTDPFPLQRSIRQGCPLASYLYVITADALGYMLQGARKLKLISGVSIPQSSIVINSHYADDNLLFLQNSEQEISNTMDVLEIYCVVSGSKLAHEK